MNMSESSRLILGLRAKGWSDTEITDFILWIGTGEERYKPYNAKKRLKYKRALGLEESDPDVETGLTETDLTEATRSKLNAIKRSLNAKSR